MGVKQRLHIRIDIVSHLLSNRGKTALCLLADVCTLLLAIFCFYISIGPILLSIEFGSVTDGLRISKAWFLLAIPFGFLLVLYRLIRLLTEDIQYLISGAEMPAPNSLIDE